MRFGLVDRPRMREMARRALAELGHDDIPPDAIVGSALGGRAAARRDRAGARRRLPRAGARRADEQPRARRRRAAVRPAPPAEGAGARDRLHLALHRGSEEVADRFVVLRDGRNAGGGATADATHDDDRRADGRRGRSTTCFRASPRQRGEPILEVDGARAGLGDRSRCIAARSSASPGCSVGPHAAAADALRPRAGAQAGACASACTRARPRPARALAAGHGAAERGSQGRRARARRSTSPTT